ncbi:MAG TPA: hypothetical protein P5060_03130 [Candidatus Absconditabacterales bacterium]|nr:hypothetical protein [Candidatus Absconditabacterales bacterium]
MKNVLIVLLGNPNQETIKKRIESAEYYILPEGVKMSGDFDLMVAGTRIETMNIEDCISGNLKSGVWSSHVVFDIYSVFKDNISLFKKRQIVFTAGQIYGKRIKKVASFFGITDIYIQDSGEKENFIFANVLRLCYCCKFTAKIMSKIAEKCKKDRLNL